MLPPTLFSSSFRLRPALLLFGDSLTQYGFGTADCEIGWCSLLAAAYTRRCDVLNRGFSGYNTRHALEILSRILDDNTGRPADANHQLLFCTVFFGTNDAAIPGEPQHVNIEEYERNMDAIVTQIRKSTHSELPIILMTPPPVEEEAWAKWREIETSDRFNHVAREYGKRIQAVAQKHTKCSVVDTWTLLEGDRAFNDDGVFPRSQYLSDGLHLNEHGNRKIFQGLMEVLSTDFPDILPMSDSDGDGRYGTTGVPLEEKLWRQLC
jgi:lysophospholipase L1-like esterase